MLDVAKNVGMVYNYKVSVDTSAMVMQTIADLSTNKGIKG